MDWPNRYMVVRDMVCSTFFFFFFFFATAHTERTKCSRIFSFSRTDVETFVSIDEIYDILVYKALKAVISFHFLTVLDYGGFNGISRSTWIEAFLNHTNPFHTTVLFYTP